MPETKKHRNGKRHPMDAASPRPRAKRTTIPVIRIVNPFNPREFTRDELTWSSKKTLADYFPLGTKDQSVVSINGMVIPPEKFAATYLKRDDNIVVCPIPAGGGDGKSILSMVAMIAVAIVAPAAAGALNTALGTGFGAGSMGMAALQAGVMMAGSMLVSSIFAPPQPKMADAEQSSSYGIDGAKNTSLEGIPVPVCYGEFRMGGNIVGLYTLNDGDTQVLYMLLSAGEGPIAGISDILVNDNPVADYKDIETQIRLGEPLQKAIDWFNETTVAQNKGVKLTTDWAYHTTTTPVDKFRLDVVAPQGLCEIDKKTGASKNRSVTLEIQYRKQGMAEWTDVQPQTITGWAVVNKQTGAREYEWRDEAGNLITDGGQLAYLENNSSGGLGGLIDDVTFDLRSRVPIYSDSLTISSNKRSAVRKSFSSGNLESSKYEIRVRRTIPKSEEAHILDELYLADVNEIQNERLSYPNTALLALKIRLGDQINGMPTVTFVNGGRIINAYGRPKGATADQWYPTASKNPAWIVYDILTNRRFGGGMASSRIDLPAFIRWAKHCDEQGLTWNGVIDTEMNVWDACQLVLRCGHAQLVPIGTRYTVVIEKKSDPVMMFSVANMVEGSYKETWLPITDRANEIDVTFYDRTDNYKERTVKVYDPAALASGQKQKTSAITLYGVVDYERAYREGQFHLNLNRHILKTASFSAPMEAIGCTVGDLVLLQSDMTDWATAGRFEQGSTASLMKLDRPVAMSIGKSYKLLIMRDSIQRAAGTVMNVVGNSVFLTGFSGAKRVRRLKVNGMDLEVLDTFNQGGGTYGVIVADAAGVTMSAPYTLHDTDVIEDHNVITRAGTISEVTLMMPLDEVPSQFAKWMFGETERVKKPFRIKSISGADYTREIQAVEYNEAVYDFSRYADTAPAPSPSGAIGPVRELDLSEETFIAGEAIVTTVYASWRSPAAGIYAGADIYVQKNDGQLEKVDEVKSATSYPVTRLAKGDRVLVKVVAFDMFGKRSAFDQAPQASYTVVGEIPDVDVGGVTGVGLVWSGRDCKLSWRYNSTTNSYEFGSEPTGADAGALDPQFKDYEIRVYDGDHKVLRRTEYTTDNSYIYSYDKNFDDGITRDLVFEIRMRDRFNNLGKPSIIDAHNPAPRVTGVSVRPTFESATVAYTHNGDSDFAGSLVYVSQNQTAVDTMSPSALVYRGPDTSITVPNLMFAAQYYCRVVPFDLFGENGLVPSATQEFKTTHLNVAAIADGVLAGSKLIPSLQSRIDLIDADAFVAGSVNARIKDLREAVFEGEDGLPAAMARIIAIDDISATSTSASARSLHEMKAKVNDPNTGLEKAHSQIAQLNDVSATTTSTAAKAIYQLNSRLNNVGGVSMEQAFKTNADAIKGLSGEYTVKIDANGYVAGIGLAVNTEGGSPTSEFIINADKLGVIMPSYPGVKPFTVGTVNGVPRVILSNALIGDASISSAMIGNAQINSLKIAGEAVTVPIVVNAPDRQRRGVGEGNRTTVNEGYITLDQAGLVYILVTASQGFYKNDRYWELTIFVNGQGPYRQIMGRQAESAPVLSVTVPLPAGKSKVEVKWSAHSDVILGYCEIFMMGVKK